MKIPKKIYLLSALVLFIGGGVTVLALQPDFEKPKTVTIQQVSAVHPEKVVPETPTNLTAAQQTQTPTEVPVSLPAPTTKVLLDASSGGVYTADVKGRNGVDLTVFTPTKEWTYEYSYSCNSENAFTIQLLGESGNPISGLQSFFLIKREITESNSQTFQMGSYGFPIVVFVSTNSDCTWHVKASEPI